MHLLKGLGAILGVVLMTGTPIIVSELLGDVISGHRHHILLHQVTTAQIFLLGMTALFNSNFLKELLIVRVEIIGLH